MTDSGAFTASAWAIIRAQYSWGPVQVGSNPYNEQSGEVVGTPNVTVNPA